MPARLQILKAEHIASISAGDQQRDMNNPLTLMSLKEQYLNLLAVNYLHQECWILNSYPAQSIEI
ncbi:hypothetical protein J2125_001984 [Erwinia toletana]|uniref:Uncharacterized protein n=1 Tax=Winslowiella toletana TaxID=92490 RepID=A0ABS4P831_9GAMM|nr:hypothetical protein [Winslowiella toletana]